MTERRLVDVLRESGVPDLIEILADRLSVADLEAVLFETHRRRAKSTSPSDMLDRFQNDPHVAPSRSQAGVVGSIDNLALSIAHPSFESLELSPICPVGSISALTSVDPASAWGAAGKNEVVSDCRAVLAMEAASRRQKDLATENVFDSVVRLSATHRELHIPFSAPLRNTSHGRVFALCTAGKADPVRLGFETAALVEQVGVQLRLLEAARESGFKIGLIGVTLYHEAIRNIDQILRFDVVDPLSAAFPTVRFFTEQERRVGRGFYSPVGFAMTVEDSYEVEHQVGLGGLVDWGEQLLDRPGEGMLVSMFATELLTRVFSLESPALS